MVVKQKQRPTIYSDECVVYSLGRGMWAFAVVEIKYESAQAGTMGDWIYAAEFVGASAPVTVRILIPVETNKIGARL